MPRRSPRTLRSQRSLCHWPTVIGRIRHIPPVIGFVADVGGFVVVIVFVARAFGVW